MGLPRLTVQPSRDVEILNNLIELAASNGTPHRVKMAAALYVGNDEIANGINQLKSHPFQARFSKNTEAIFLHAEIDAIKNFLRTMTVGDLSRTTLYVCRVKWADHGKNQLTIGLAKPCIGCMRAIITFGIRRVVYTVDSSSYEILS